MKITLKLILTTLILTLSASGMTYAVEAEKPVATEKVAEKEAAPKKNTYPLYGMVVSFNDNTLTIKGGGGKEDRKYSVSADTTIVNGEKSATTADIKEGQWIGGLLEKATEGNDKALKLNIGVKQKVAKEEPKAEVTGEAKPKTTKKKES